jgi:hypothetical protein
MQATRLLSYAATICLVGCGNAPATAVPGETSTIAPLASPADSKSACPAREFEGFLRAFASDDGVRRQFTMPSVLVTDWKNVEETQQGTVVESVDRDSYVGFNLRHMDDGFHDVGPDGDVSPNPSNLKIEKRGEGYLVAYSYNLSEGNSWLFKAKDGCWFLTEDPEPSDP